MFDFTEEAKSCESDLIVLTDELREMAGSESLREEFRALRRNARAIEREIGVDALAHWLTVIGRICPGATKPRCFVHYTHVRI